MPSPMVLEDPEVSPQGDFWTSPEMFDPKHNRPVFSRRTVAEVFFGRSYMWIHMALKSQLVLDGIAFVPDEQFTRSAAGYFELKLYDIERLAHAFAESGVITIKQLERTVLLVKIVAQNYRYLQ